MKLLRIALMLCLTALMCFCSSSSTIAQDKIRISLVSTSRDAIITIIILDNCTGTLLYGPRTITGITIFDDSLFRSTSSEYKLVIIEDGCYFAGRYSIFLNGLPVASNSGFGCYAYEVFGTIPNCSDCPYRVGDERGYALIMDVGGRLTIGKGNTFDGAIGIADDGNACLDADNNIDSWIYSDKVKVFGDITDYLTGVECTYTSKFDLGKCKKCKIGSKSSKSGKSGRTRGSKSSHTKHSKTSRSGSWTISASSNSSKGSKTSKTSKSSKLSGSSVPFPDPSPLPQIESQLGIPPPPIKCNYAYIPEGPDLGPVTIFPGDFTVYADGYYSKMIVKQDAEAKLSATGTFWIDELIIEDDAKIFAIPAAQGTVTCDILTLKMTTGNGTLIQDNIMAFEEMNIGTGNEITGTLIGCDMDIQDENEVMGGIYSFCGDPNGFAPKSRAPRLCIGDDNFFGPLPPACLFEVEPPSAKSLTNRIEPVFKNSELSIIKLWPNPASDIVNFSIITSQNVNIKMEVFNMTGSKVGDIFNGLCAKGGRQDVIWSTAHLTNGVYTWTMIDSRGDLQRGKLILTR